MTSKQLRNCYLNFFKERGHAVIASASLIPENDPTVLFTTAGMHPLVPYLLGQPHPAGKRLANVQKCVRTGDLESVGDATHCTFFEMLGNWSLGDYFKQESIGYSFDFLTKTLGIDAKKLWVTVFAGDEDCPRDEESATRWKQLGIPAQRITYLPKKDNWWIAGETGPCGPDTEIFMDTSGRCEIKSQDCRPGKCDCGRFVEVWNNVFMQFNKTADGKYTPLAQKNVDTGMGLERMLCTLSGLSTVYETDLFKDAVTTIKKLSPHSDDIRAVRIIADHIRTAVMMIGDERGIAPGNTDAGYILRRLIRRAVRFARSIGADPARLAEVAAVFIDKYKGVYKSVGDNAKKIISELNAEIERFSKTLENGLKELEKVLRFAQNNRLSGKTAFRLYDTFGFPLEMTEELCAERGFSVDRAEYAEAEAKHREKSSAGAEQKFSGGLADSGERTTNLHTATHIMLRALKQILGGEVDQKGSNINHERLRFDFNFPRPLTPEEIGKIEALVNDVISSNLPVTSLEMTVKEAKAKNAIGVFDERYDAKVKVYDIGGFDLQICGGPHAERTGALGYFKIIKEQSSSAGIRRIKAVLM